MSDLPSAEAIIAELNIPRTAGLPHGIALPRSEAEVARNNNRSATYRHWYFADKPMLETLDHDVSTLHDLFDKSVRRFPRNPCLGERKWLPEARRRDDRFTWATYAEIGKRRADFGAGLVEIHNRIRYPKQEQFAIGLWSPNRPDWQVVDLGCMSQRLYSVSLYETLGPDSVEFILNHCEAPCIVATLPHIPTILKLKPRLPHLKIVISMDPLEQGEPDACTKRALLSDLAAQSGVELYSMEQVQAIGRDSQRPMRRCIPDDIYTINYTSGTTGMPKGVVLTHRSALSSNCTSRIIADGTSADSSLSYLPLAHVMQRLVEHSSFATGSRVGYFSGDLATLVDDIKILQPTTFVSVPRLFNRFNSAIRAASVDAPGFKGKLSRHIIDTKLASMKLPMGQAYNTHWLYDRIWTRKVKSAVGFGRLRGLVGGSAPIDPQVQTFLAAAFAVPFGQGYGMTESSGGATCQLKGDFTTGHVGPPTPCAEICLESVPDLGYSVHDKPYPRGELLMRGPCISPGYLKNDEENGKAYESDGWFHSGDIAQVDELGCFKIIDRKKNILKLSQGEYVAPERIENVYLANSGLIQTALVHGDASQSTLVGIFGVEPEAFSAFAAEVTGRPVNATDAAELSRAVADPLVRREFLRIIDEIGRKKKLAGYEKVKSLMLAVDPFTVENELLTPTLKLKRQQAAKVYRADIERMYEEINSSTPTAKL